jgi:Putative rRNA methylase
MISSPFKPHIELAQRYWKEIVGPQDIVIDATCGNGHDTLFLARLNPKMLYAIDIQSQAIEETSKQLQQYIAVEERDKITLLQTSHETFPLEIQPQSVKLLVYNLGYLPKGNKRKTTLAETTVLSLKNALSLMSAGGLISVTCYPGHPEGKEEEREVLEFVSGLSPQDWSCCFHQWVNRPDSPSLLCLRKTFRSTQ